MLWENADAIYRYLWQRGSRISNPELIAHAKRMQNLLKRMNAESGQLAADPVQAEPREMAL